MKCNPSNCFLLGDVLAIQGDLIFYVNLKMCFLHFCRNKTKLLIRIASKLQLPLSSLIILTLHLPLTTWMSFLLMFLPNFPQQHFVTFSSSITLLTFITEQFVLLNADVNLIIPLFGFSDHSFCVLVLYPTIVLTALNLSCLMTSCGILRDSCV